MSIASDYLKVLDQMTAIEERLKQLAADYQKQAADLSKQQEELSESLLLFRPGAADCGVYVEGERAVVVDEQGVVKVMVIK